MYFLRDRYPDSKIKYRLTYLKIDIKYKKKHIIKIIFYKKRYCKDNVSFP